MYAHPEHQHETWLWRYCSEPVEAATGLASADQKTPLTTSPPISRYISFLFILFYLFIYFIYLFSSLNLFFFVFFLTSEWGLSIISFYRFVVTKRSVAWSSHRPLTPHFCARLYFHVYFAQLFQIWFIFLHYVLAFWFFPFYSISRVIFTSSVPHCGLMGIPLAARHWICDPSVQVKLANERNEEEKWRAGKMTSRKNVCSVSELLNSN